MQTRMSYSCMEKPLSEKTERNTMTGITVIKRNGNREPLNLEKIHKVLFWACENLTGVSVSEIEIRAQLQLTDGVETKRIHDTLIRSASELISEETPNYQYVAARLVNYQLRKEIYNDIQPWTIKDIAERNVALKKYDSDILTAYNDEEFKEFENIVKHDRDFDLTYVAMEQMRGKYLVKNRKTECFYETPQVAYLMIAATAFINEDRSIRMGFIKDYYDAISQHDLSLPTPVMSGLRTPTRQFSSCVLIESADDLESIIATDASITRYVSKKAGIGIGVGRIRGLGSEIRGGEAVHTGMIPFLRKYQSSLKSCSQGGVRSGSGTVSYPFFHYEFPDLIVLKNNKGTEQNRLRQMDYCVQFNRLFYKRLIEGGKITFFSSNEVTEMLEAFYEGDNDRFEKLYIEAENNPDIMKREMSATEVASIFATERKETGRIYIQNIDNVNQHSAFDPKQASVRMTNLCVEISLPTLPLYDANDPNGWIALCTLSGVNAARMKADDTLERVAYLAVRALDNLLSYQDYVVPAAKTHTELFRPLGIGIINFAYYLAKNGKKYNDDALELVDEFAERWSYYLIKASIELAKERGACKGLHMTKYGQGILPIDTRKPSIDSLVPHKPKMDWEALRADLIKYGIRNATVMALMPAETSAQIANATNGIEPVRSLVTSKKSKHGKLKQVVPEINKLKNAYDMLWDQKSPRGYFHVTCVLQKYIDQSISTNQSYNPKHYPDEMMSLKDVISDILDYYKYGGENLYYVNTFDGNSDEDDVEKETPPETTLSETIEIEDEDDCESCKL